ncbi:F510_1955 family glycosylhydrolase [Sphaerotilus sp.]|uniref:F510_1955 family glycosylhydrolase n=1 Tax=Sphaerotilus sp. TaxID=2093942 RepID=UPI002ACEDD02|nr:glycosyl hydrolase [Sphaerotilus sp.]MDZ7855769.1 glycosyl hydrolase [Sphaerotilus sp.]
MRSNLKKHLPALMLALAFASGAMGAARAGDAVTLTHVHGLAFSADGSRLMIPSHHGLAIYETGDKGRWSKADGPAHDYMGFAAARDALYSSGHPAPGSGLTNPFGLIKSVDGGKTWRMLGLEGESDFHLLATSYGTHSVYVVNPGTNSRMREPGLYHTEDDGMKWTRAAANGLGGEIRSLAVHPGAARIVAVGTADGLYLSRDAGGRFERLVAGAQVLGVTFDLDGTQLWFSSYAGQAALARLALTAGAKPQALAIPALSDDAVAYIAQNPARRSEIAIASFKRNVYLSRDAGRTWKPIATHGASHE